MAPAGPGSDEPGEALRSDATEAEGFDASHDSRDLLARLDLAEARCSNLQDTVADLTLQLDALRNSVRFRIGDAILQAMRSPKAMLRLPASLARIYRAHRYDQHLNERLLALADEEHPSSDPRGGEAGPLLPTQADRVTLPRGVSVVVPAYRAVTRIDRCLETIAEQTLDREKFEALVVLNGPDDGARERIELFAAREPSLCLRILESDPPGAGRARNVGLATARFDHVCFLDDDDELSPTYLEALCSTADGSSVVIAPLSDLTDGHETPSALNERLRLLEGAGRITYRDIAPAFSLNAAKLAPTALLRHFSFPEDLSSGEDVAFWAEVCARAAPPIKVVPHLSGARYIRHLRINSVSRRPASYDFNVAERLSVVAHLDSHYAQANAEGRAFLKERIEAQARFVVRYLQAHPQDYPRAAAEIMDRAYRFPLIRLVNARLARTLVYSACFPPYLDPSGIVMAKRIAAMDHPVDVISNGMAGARQSDPRLLEVAVSRLGHLEEAGAAAQFAHWPAIARYVELAGRLARSLEAGKDAPYAEIYSRALWPASHFAAAVHKLRNPRVGWTAEFSDPIQKDINGADRPGPIPLEWLERQDFLKALRARGFEFPTTGTLFFWCEALPIVLADRLVFTNSNQLSYMASYQRDDQLRTALLAKATISPHPLPPKRLYEMGAPNYPLDDARTNVAYFGSFYANRGLEAVFDAMAGLPAAKRGRLCLHVFTQQQDAARSGAARCLGDSLRINPLVGYLDFLALTRRFHYLLALDADTTATHPQNPFLPSKLADYIGSGRPIWALCQHGSPMSSTDLPPGSVKTELGNTAGIRQALEELGVPRAPSAE
jgi:glycosyltransferase involved in cell wall biosynthesis